MKTWKQRTFSPWAFAAFAAIIVAGFIFSGCKTGNDATNKTVAAIGVDLDETTLGLTVGDEHQFIATVLPKTATDKTVTWSTSNKNAVTVDENGNVKAVAVGEAKITAMTKNGKKGTCDVTVGLVAVTHVVLDKITLELEVGQEFKLTPTVHPERAANKSVDWDSDTPAVATVSSNGTVKAVSVPAGAETGTAKITVKTRNGNFEAECVVTVKPVTVTGVTLNKSSISLFAEASETLTATVAPAEADQSVTWKSSDSKIAAVDANGKVTGVAKGPATITATAGKKADGTPATGTCTVTVEYVTLTGVTLNRSTLGLTIDDEETLIATVQPETGTQKTVTWDSSNKTAAIVDANGKVTALATGTTTITVTTDGKKADDQFATATCAVTVGTTGVTSVTVSPKTLELQIGQKSTLSADVQPLDAVNKDVEWTSSNEDVATVDEEGEVTAVGIPAGSSTGTATITATTVNGSKTDTCTVTVKPVPVTSVALDKSTLTLNPGGSGTLTVTVLPTGATNKAVTWDSSDKTKATLSVNSTTGVATVTAVATGTTTISVTSDADITKKAECVVTVSIANPVTGVTLNRTDFTLGAGFYFTLVATVAPTTAYDRTVTWSSSDPAVVEVTDGTQYGLPAGSVIGWTGGTATITATTNGLQANGQPAKVTVLVSVPPDVEGMAWLNGNTFSMGSPGNEQGRNSDETQHNVTLSAFYIAGETVTQFQYEEVMGYNASLWPYTDEPESSWPTWGNAPMDSVGWYEAVEYCNKLTALTNTKMAAEVNARTDLTPAEKTELISKLTLTAAYTIGGRAPATGYPITAATVSCDWTATGYRLPTEAEWEYACRAGTTTRYNWGANATAPTVNTQTGSVTNWGTANFSGNSGQTTNRKIGYPVPGWFYNANGWGLYCMHGNVEEWCWDLYGTYATGAQTDPKGATTGTQRVVRGGSFNDVATDIRSASRWRYDPTSKNPAANPYGNALVGFRVVLPYTPPAAPSSRTVIGPSVTTDTQEAKIVPQGIRQGLRILEKNSASPVRPEALRRKAELE